MNRLSDSVRKGCSLLLVLCLLVSVLPVSFANSAWKENVQVLYRTFLDREADEGGLQAWIAALQAGHSREEIAASFAYSPEFSNLMKRYGF